MKCFFRALAVAACALAMAACNQAGPGGKTKPPGAWLGDFDAALKESAASKKPILVDFSADW